MCGYIYIMSISQLKFSTHKWMCCVTQAAVCRQHENIYIAKQVSLDTEVSSQYFFKEVSLIKKPPC
jgi:hypothetical protein